eukprot:CAMPEP_0115601750 /NCGR_PEP_ID=MMETSP0272-20121206/15562_1 /TAXON_ID=71861 /ORGANISM="Scrippsiella trochoidea, Strain CCMP3099" /LENGTH=43 /DNA_ID= /DNA_START= /DNA_END= /DNA_ORIENTATION=
MAPPALARQWQGGGVASARAEFALLSSRRLAHGRSPGAPREAR